jgi:hypothetical protein
MGGDLLLKASNLLLERIHLQRDFVAALGGFGQRIAKLGQVGLVLRQLFLCRLELAVTLQGN